MGQFIDRLENKTGLKGDKLFDRIVAQERDLEFLLGELEEWRSKAYYRPTAIGSPISPYGEPGFQDDLSSIVQRANELDQQVRQEIFKTYRHIPGPQGIQEHHLPLFESAFRVLQAKGQPLVVFTTNYDPAVEDLCEALRDAYELVEGFDMTRLRSAMFGTGHTSTNTRGLPRRKT